MTLLLLFFAIVASAAASPTTLPIEIRDNFPILVAVINDIAVPLKFDLGDGDTLVLQQEVLDQAKAVATGETVKMMGLNGPFDAPLYRVPRIRIGDLVFTDVVARLDRRDDSYVPGASGEKGYLGTGLLKSHVVVIDYPRRTMTLFASESADESRDACQGTAVPFSLKWPGEPVTAAETDFGPALLWWDTGSPLSFLTHEFVGDSSLPAEGATVESRRFRLGGTEFGPWRFDVWSVSPPGFHGIVGYDFFASHVVCVDFPGKRLVIAGAPESR